MSRLRLPGWPVWANLALVGLWIWLYRAVFPYFAVIFTREEFRTNQVVLAGALALVAVQARKGSLAVRFDRPAQLRPAALAVVAGASLLYLGVERFLDIHTLAASLFALAGYGLLGLWMEARAWRQGLPAALLLAGALPFGEHMETFIGYPVRLATARMVRDGLSAVGVQSLGVDTILVFENGVSKVDLPCSGVKSLWTGGLFFLAASWIERRPLNLRWLLAGLGLGLALLAANLARVGVLVTVGEVAGWRLLAELLHVPLGVLGFAAACGFGLVLLRGAGSLPEPAPGEPPAPAYAAGWQVTAGLAGVLALMGWLYAPRPQQAAPPAVTYTFPSTVITEAWPLSRGERDWLAQAGVHSAQRLRFRYGELTGSLLLVASDTWRAHHRPENCFGVYGLMVDREASVLAAEGFPVRLLWLSTGKQAGLLTAAYWMQAGERATDDYGERMWADLSPRRQRWVLVTVLFDQPVDPGSAAAREFYRMVRGAVR